MIRTILALLSLAAPTVADVWTVGVPGNFATIQEAVDVASDGDIIVVRDTLTETSFPTLIDGKGLTMVADLADPNQLLSLSRQWIVTNQTEEQTFAMWGFRLSLEQHPGGALCLDLRARGTVLVSNSRFLGAPDTFEACSVALSKDVHFVDVTVVGGDGTQESRDPFNGVPGSDSLYSIQAELNLVNSTFQGGNGGDGCRPIGGGNCGSFGGHGGFGYIAEESTVQWSNCLFLPGQGGTGGCGDGGPGVDLVILPPSTGLSIDTPRWIESVAPVRTPTPSVVTVHGAPGDRVFLRVLGDLPGPAWVGQFPPTEPERWIGLGPIPASGSATTTLPSKLAPGQFASSGSIEAWIQTPEYGWISAGKVPWIVLDPVL